MAKSESKKLLKFDFLDKPVESFDTHEMGEYWDEMPEAHFEVNKENAFLSSRHCLGGEPRSNSQEENSVVVG